MAIRAAALVKEPAGDEPVTAASLIRRLVEQATGDEASGVDSKACPTTQSEEIILDIDLDDARYLLVRLPKAERPCAQLSPREQEIVRMVGKGHSNKVIADVLCISTWTVCTHLRRIFAKLGVSSRAAMVARLMDNSPFAGARQSRI
jgi:DNA-binding CsgD family transcriptional regulator